MVSDDSRATLVRLPPLDPSKSDIENVLELTELSAIAPDIFTNTRPLWHPPGARGIYGGCVIAQSLSAAQRTVPSQFTVHSMHCYFVLAGDATIPVMYYVEHVREGKSFATRTVQARQRGRCIFTATLSFVRENSAGAKTVAHATPIPAEVVVPSDANTQGFDAEEDGGVPFESRRMGLTDQVGLPHSKKARQWVRCKGTISPAGGHEAHLSALAYMSDSYFIGTVARVHKLWRFPPPIDPTSNKKALDPAEEAIQAAKDARLRLFKELEGFGGDLDNTQGRPEVGMMVSLDHTIFFHEPRQFRADEWMFTEMESPWAGDGRGVVIQKMFTKEGVHVATCVQEGVMRLKQDQKSKL